jgi:hypothetical protein
MNKKKHCLVKLMCSLKCRIPININTQNNINRLCIVLFTSAISACQVTTPIVDNSPQHADNPASYSEYYLWLKTLNYKQVLVEERIQKKRMKTLPSGKKTIPQGKLILIYSLPTSDIHKPYKAKKLLNDLLLASNALSKRDLAFTMLLRDQLNSQLRLYEKQMETNTVFNKVNDEHRVIVDELNQKLNQVNNQLDQVNKQLILLKKIDQNINERG